MLLSTSIPHMDRESYDYEVTYLLPQKNDLVHQFESAGIPVFCLGMKRSYDLRIIFSLYQLLKDRKIDLVHIHLPYAGIVGRIAARLAGVKAVVYTEHNVLELYNALTRLMDWLTYPLDNMTIAVSESVRESALRFRFSKPAKVMTILNGIDMERVNNTQQSEIAPIRESLGIPVGDYVIGNIAHIRPEKGQEYLIQAARKVINKCPNTTFVIVGREKSLEARQVLEAQAEALGIRDKIVFTGFREDVLRIMAACDLFVLSSLFEGLPVALLEAMAQGKPSVVTAVGGIPEVITDGHEGFLVQPKDSETLADRIITLLDDAELRCQMSARAVRQIEEKFSVKRMVGEVESVYARALSS